MSEFDSHIWDDLLKTSLQNQKRGEDLSVREISKLYGVTRHEAGHWKWGLDNRDVLHNDLKTAKKLRRKTDELNQLRSQNRKLHRELKQLEDELEIKEHVADSEIDVDFIEHEDDGKPNRCVAIALLSDVHIEERVDLDMTNGLNEYTPEIGKQRLELYYKNVVKLTEKERKHAQIDTLIIAHLGDFITGYIHDDLKESNYLDPGSATTYIQNILVAGLKYLIDHGNFKKIIVPFASGNHGRTTPKKRHNTAYENSHEMRMYERIIDYFNDPDLNDRYKGVLDFRLSKGEFEYVDIMGRKLRFGHGDHFRYNNGQAGIIGPMKKWLTKQNEQTKADMTFIGHWHEILTEPTSDSMVNGSIIGLNAYAMQFGGPVRRPQQVFTLLDEVRGFSIRAHIDCTEY